MRTNVNLRRHVAVWNRCFNIFSIISFLQLLLAYRLLHNSWNKSTCRSTTGCQCISHIASCLQTFSPFANQSEMSRTLMPWHSAHSHIDISHSTTLYFPDYFIFPWYAYFDSPTLQAAWIVPSTNIMEEYASFAKYERRGQSEGIAWLGSGGW